MKSRFEKDGMKILDGFDTITMGSYQMVPEGAKRPMSVVTGNNSCELVVDDDAIVMIRDLIVGGLWSSRVILPNTRFHFSIESIGKPGHAVGHTVLTLIENQVPPPVGVLSVSVKAVLPQSYVTLFLEDAATPKHFTTRNRGQAASFLKKVEETYLAQANVKLTQIGKADVRVPHDLGNPLLLDQAMTVPPGLGSVHAPRTVLGAIHAATELLNPAFMASYLIRVYCCWDVGELHRDPKKIVGETDIASKSSFIEDGTNEFVFAHELGHTLLGLEGYHNTRRKRLMFENLALDPTFKLDQSEIDTINTSGT